MSPIFSALCPDKLLLALLIVNSLFYSLIEAQNQTTTPSPSDNDTDSNDNSSSSGGQQQNPYSSSNQYSIYPADQFNPVPFILSPYTNPFYVAGYSRPTQLIPQAAQTPPLQYTGGGGFFGHHGFSIFQNRPNQQTSPDDYQQNNQRSNMFRSFDNYQPPVVPAAAFLFPHLFRGSHLIPHFSPFPITSNFIAHYPTVDDEHQRKKHLQAKPKLIEATAVVSSFHPPDVIGNGRNFRAVDKMDEADD